MTYPSHTTPNTIIIGAGIAGLSAGLHLAERGLTPIIIEADTRVGGRLSAKESVEINGNIFPLEHGVHGIWSGYVNLKSMLARHDILPGLVKAKEETWVYRDKNFISRAPIGSAIRNSIFPAPIHYLQLFLRPKFLWALDIHDWASLFSVWSTLIMSVGTNPFVEDQPLEGYYLGDQFNKWSPVMRALFSSLTRNGLSTNADQIPLAGFLAFLRFYTVLRRDAWAFGYLPNGGGALCEALSEKLKARGAEIRLGRRVTRVEKIEEGYRVETSDGEQLTAKHVILATDSPAAKSIISSSFKADKFFFPRGLPNAVVRLWFDKKPKTDAEAGMFSGDFLMHNFFWLDQIYDDYKNWAKHSGGSAIEIHIYDLPDVLKQKDALLLTNIIVDFYRAHPELRGHLIGQHLQRNDATHTMPALGAKEKHLGVITPWQNFFCAGDWVRYQHPAFFLERACVTGIAAANEVLKSSDKEIWEIKSQPKPELFAGWIESLMMKGKKDRKDKKIKRKLKTT